MLLMALALAVSQPAAGGAGPDPEAGSAARTPLLEAVCMVKDEINGLRLTRIWFECPTEVEVEDAAGLQAYADRVAGQLDLPLNLRRLRPSDVNREVTFAKSLSGWALPEPVWFILSTADIDRSRGKVSEAACSTRYTITSGGTAQDMETACEAFVYSDDTPASTRPYLGSVADSFTRWRWFVPAGAGGICRVTQTTHSVASEDYRRPWLDDPFAPRPVFSATLDNAPQCS